MKIRDTVTSIPNTVELNYQVHHFAEEMRRKEDIQLLEVPIFSPRLWLDVSAGNTGFGVFLLGTPAGEFELDETCGLFKFYKPKHDISPAETLNIK